MDQLCKYLVIESEKQMYTQKNLSIIIKFPRMNTIEKVPKTCTTQELLETKKYVPNSKIYLAKDLADPKNRIRRIMRKF